MSDEKKPENAADKEAQNKARREKIEKIALQVKNMAVSAGQTVLPIAKKGFSFASSFIKEQLDKRKQKTSTTAAPVAPTTPAAPTEPPKSDQNPPK